MTAGCETMTLSGKRPRWESVEVRSLEYWTPASPLVLSPADSTASTQFADPSDEYQPLFHQHKRLRLDPECRPAPASCSSTGSSFCLRPSPLGEVFHRPLQQPHCSGLIAAWQGPCGWQQRDIPLSGGFGARQAEVDPALDAYGGPFRSEPSLRSLPIASRIATSLAHREALRASDVGPRRTWETNALPPAAASGRQHSLYSLSSEPFQGRDLSCHPAAGRNWTTFRASQGSLASATFQGIYMARSAPKPVDTGLPHHLHGSAHLRLRADLLRAELQAAKAQQALPRTADWRPAARLPQLQWPLSSGKEVLAKWGCLLRLAPDTLFFTEHLFTRLRPQYLLGRLDWTTVLLLLGCLWIACKLEECRLSLPTAHTIAGLVASSLGVAVSAALVNAVEVKVLGLLKWQPLAGWDDLTHVKGRLLAFPSGAW